MSILVSGINPRAITAGSTASPSAPRIASLALAPAASLQISAAARLAYAAQQGQLTNPKIQPLNIIWGNNAK